MRFVVLGSGSKGNAIVVQGAGTTVLVDCGLTPKALRGRMDDAGLGLADLDAMLITHGHGDHVRGAGRIAGGLRLRTFATEPTARFLARGGGLINHVPIARDARFQVGALELRAFPTPHDAPGSVGFVVECEGARMAICTDLGEPTEDVAAALRDCDTLYLEFNHDIDMLQRGPYPPSLKRRVSSGLGHLSNAQAAHLLAAVAGPRLRQVVLAHLSETNNTPSLALSAAATAVDERRVELVVAPQHEPSRWFRVGEGAPVARAGVEDAPAARQVLPVGPATAPPQTPPRARPAVSTSPPRPARAHAPAALPSIAVSRQLALFGGAPR